MVSSLEIVSTFWDEKDTENNIKLLTMLQDSEEKGTDSFLINLFMDPVKIIGDTAADILLQRHPWLRLSVHHQFEIPDSLKNDPKALVWDELKEGVTQFVRNYSSEYRRYIAFTHFPGLHHLVYDALIRGGLPETAEKFGKAVNLEQRFERRELLFVPTYKCNLSCSYCYAKDWHKKFNGDASLEEIRSLITWMKNQGLDTLSLAGGEPTTYKYLEELFSLVKDMNFTLNIASNMLFSEKVGDMLNSQFVEMVTAHYDQSYLESEKYHNLYCSNLALLKEKNIDFRVRYTLTSTSDAKEWNAIFTLLDEHQVDSLHFAPTFMNFDSNNRGAACEDGTKSEALGIMTRFCDDALERNISLHLCKPIALCLFPEEKLNEYLVQGVLRNACVAFDSNYSRNITVNPDLSMFPCTALAETGPKITTFSNITEAGHYYRDYLQGLLKKPFLSECTRCFFYYSGYCQQVCLVEKHHVSSELIDLRKNG